MSQGRKYILGFFLVTGAMFVAIFVGKLNGNLISSNNLYQLAAVSGTGSPSPTSSVSPTTFLSPSPTPLYSPLPSVISISKTKVGGKTSLVSEGLIGYWAFEEASGTNADDTSDSNNPGTLTTSGPTRVPGKIGRALSFDGVDDYVTIPNSSTLSPSTFSISFWVKSNVPPAVYDGILGKTTNMNWFDGWGFYSASPSNITFFSGNYSIEKASSPITINSTAWNHVVGIFDGSATHIYVNKIPGTSGPGAIRSTTGNLEIGRLSSNDYNFKGSIDDVRIYDHPLSVSEIEGLYSLGFSDITPPTISAVSSSVTRSSATISWSTNDDADTQIEWGSTDEYGNSTTLNPDLVRDHSQTLGQLQPGATYHYRVKSRDEDTNLASSSDNVFTTNTTPPRPPNAEVVDSNNLIPFPSAALWSTVVNVKPGNNETVSFNPPLFSWMYSPDPRDLQTDTNSYMFLFQAAYSESDLEDCTNRETCANLAVNVLTRTNLYNTLAPFSSSKVYWRVGYIIDSEYALSIPNGLTRGDISTTSPSIIEAFIPRAAWGPTRNFTIASGATNWDRSALADETILQQRSAHPHMLFNPSNQKAIYDSIRTNDLANWNYMKEVAVTAMEYSWWKNPSVETVGYYNLYPYVDHMREALNSLPYVAFVWQMTKNAAPGSDDAALHTLIRDSGPEHILSLMGQIYTSKRYGEVDFSCCGYWGGIPAIALGYDWLYELMDDDERNIVLNALERNARYITRASSWWWVPRDHYGRPETDPTGVYGGNFRIAMNAFARKASSHGSNAEETFISALATLGDSTDPAQYPASGAMREFFDLGVNYFLGKTFQFANDPINEGRGYSISYLDSAKLAVYLQSVYPEANIRNIPFFRHASDLWTRVMPVGFTQGHGAWGDSGTWGSEYYLGRLPVRTDAIISGSGELLQANSLEGTRAPSDNETFIEMVVPHYFSTPQMANTSLTKINPTSGWATSCSHAPNTSDCFNNGVGFLFQARPQGKVSHGSYSDLNYELWAYGSLLTDSGIDGPGYSSGRSSMWRNSLFVNGFGQAHSQYEPTDPYYGRIFAATTTDDYVYVAADATNAYPKRAVNLTPTDWELYAFLTSHSGAPLSELERVQRHLLFVKNKYLVVFDDLQNNSPATFSSLYHVLENTVQFSDASKTKYTYTSNIKKLLDPTSTSLPVTVHVAFINDPGTLSVQDLTGPNVYHNPFTIEDYDFPNAHKAAHSLWTSNAIPQQDFHFMSVIYPQKPGTNPPTITRVNDFTVSIDENSDGVVDDVISFNPDTAPQDTTILVDLEDLVPLPVVDDIVGNTIYVPPPPPTRNLTITKSGTGQGAISGTYMSGTITNSLLCGPTQSNCSFDLPDASSVSLFGAPSPNHTFSSWGGACPSTLATTSSCTFTLSSNKTVTATFSPTVIIIGDEPPVISSVATSTTSTSATVSWNTDISSISQIEYGHTNQYGYFSSIVQSLSPTSHSHLIIDLDSNTTYYYRLISRDPTTNLSTTFSGTFTTPGTSGSITISAPNTLVQRQAGYTYSSIWTQTPNTMRVDLSVEKDDGQVTLIASNILGKRNNYRTDYFSYPWAIPEDFPPGNYKFLIRGTEIQANDASDQHFKIIPKQAPQTSLHNSSDTTIITTANPTPTPNTIAPDETPPSVLITLPSSDTLSIALNSDITLEATTSDNVAVTGLEFYLDGSKHGSKLLHAPYARVMRHNGNASKTYTLYAVAEDAAGNRSTSTPKTFTVNVQSGNAGNNQNPAPQGGTGGGGGGAPFRPGTATIPVSVPGTVARSPLARSLTLGSTGTDVSTLQSLLVQEGLITIYQQGRFDTYTEKAVKAFQKKYKIVTLCTPVTGCGKVGPKTMIKVNALLATKVPAPITQQLPVVPTTLPPTTTSSSTFGRTLRQGMTGSDVKALQVFLNSHGYPVATTGVGSRGKESTYFGPATTRALIRFQEAYRAEILTPSGLTRGTGVMGEATRRKVEGIK